jgi:peptidoglycan-associated lipoprotein
MAPQIRIAEVISQKSRQGLIFHLTVFQTADNLFINFMERGWKVKNRKWSFLLVPILAIGLCLGCGKKVISTDAMTYPPSREAPRPMEAKPAETPEVKPEAASPGMSADQEREAKIREETLRQEDLRQQALKEEAARREALAREAGRKKLALESIYFDFDQWTIREDQKEAMLRDAEWLKANPQVKVRLEGNCDERGTAEYNLALGQKRADSAKAFLEGLGIPGNRVQTISYGEERPLNGGHTEAAWAKNRRVDIVPVR